MQTYVGLFVCAFSVCRSAPIGTLYFDKKRLSDQWSGQQQTMALFERIRTVGKVGVEKKVGVAGRLC